jgi:hypothetical protein
VRAKLVTYGGKNHTVMHTQLLVDGQFVADSSSPEHAAFFKRIADQLNGDEPTEVVHDKWGE